MSNPYRWLGWKREREVYKICLKHFDKIFEVVSKLNELMIKFRDEEEENYRNLFYNIFDLEREADNIKEDIIRELSKGIIHPMDRDDIIRLILSADDIAAFAKAASRKLMYVDAKIVPKNIVEGLVKMTDMSTKEMNHLRDSLQYLIKEPKKAFEEANKVERMEESIDEFRDDLIAVILKWADEVSFVSHWLMIKEVAENIEQMSDVMEDTGDIIRGLAVTG